MDVDEHAAGEREFRYAVGKIDACGGASAHVGDGDDVVAHEHLTCPVVRFDRKEPRVGERAQRLEIDAEIGAHLEDRRRRRHDGMRQNLRP